MAIKLNEFIARFEHMQKQANETLSAEPGALVGVNDMPGSEHDAKVPAGAKEPDKEVQQGQPAGATTAEGAVNGGDAKPLNEGKLEVDQPLENPEQKPLITDDALTAKEASDRYAKLVDDLLSDLKGTQKQAQCGGGASAAPKVTTSAPDKKDEKKNDKKDAGKSEEKKAGTDKIVIDQEMLGKLAAATASFMAGQKAAETAIKKAAEKTASDKSSAIALIKAACVKAAQESGLDATTAATAADNAMAAAGIPADNAGETASADAGAEDAAAGVDIPDDVTEEELGEAIVDLVQSGELDVDTAKALVDEIAGEAGEGAADEGITDDQAAEIIANGLESGEITPEQAKELVDAIEAGGAEDAAAATADTAAAENANAEAQGAADAAAAIQDAQDEAQGAADAEAAMKTAAAAIRKDALNKVASAIVAKREQAKQPQGLMGKVASILTQRKAAIDAKIKADTEKQASAQLQTDEEKYLAGFCKKASEMGVDPQALARYVCANKERFAQAK